MKIVQSSWFIVHRRLTRAIFAFLLTAHYLLPTTVYAACNPMTEQETDIGCIPTDPLAFAAKIYSVGLGVIGAVALVFIMYGGYIILSSRGDQLALAKGKSYIVSAVIGLVLAVAGYALYQILAVDVIKLPGFSR